MATVRTRADDIQRQMAEIRSLLHWDMREVVNVATTATDWRSHLRAHPWLAIGIAFSTGFLLVPHRRSRPATLVVQPPAADVRDQQVVVKPEKSGRLPLFRWFLGAIIPFAVRAAQSYALSHVENFLANQQSGPRPEAASGPASPGRTARYEGRGFAAHG